MSRNLISAKAWESGRKDVCKKCIYFESDRKDSIGYEWQKCQRQTKKDSYFTKWEGNRCRFFRPKKDNKE